MVEDNGTLMVDAKTAGKMVGLSARQVMNLSRMGRFPAAVRLSRKMLRWRSSDIRRWVETKGEANASHKTIDEAE